jgi:hypothetical protein
MIHYEAAKTELLLESARNNTSHGDRLTPAAQEDPGRSITIFDYHRLLTQTGWKVIRRIECPLSTERLTGNQVQKMQTKRILGTIGRTLLSPDGHKGRRPHPHPAALAQNLRPKTHERS